MPKKKFLLTLLLSISLIASVLVVEERFGAGLIRKFLTPEELAESYKKAPAAPSSPSPTPRPLTFSEMNSLYGPCTVLSVIFYHHIQDMEVARSKNQQNLSVSPETFREHLTTLKNKGYTILSMSDLVNFFDAGAAIPKKSVLLTFDDGYDDFYTTAVPILREFGYKATMFLSTGLVGNPGYLSWDQVGSSAGSGILFANHTWSHKNMKQAKDVVEREIATADTQLSERGLNSPRVFAYPYGFASNFAKAELASLGYSLAFTTRPGSVLCTKQRLELPRVRVGNAPLSNFGF